MSHLDILVPFGLPAAEMAGDLLRACKTPALAMLLARAKTRRSEVYDGFSRALPHEVWLARDAGFANRSADDEAGAPSTSPPVAAAVMQRFALAPSSGHWFILNPVHLHVARDHLVLTDLRQLPLSEQASKQLFDAAQPLFEEAGKSLVYGDAKTWFVRADEWHALHTATPDAACGHNIDIWMPVGAAARDWRKLQNEVQMQWHIDPVNAQREKPVNSVWLWGGAPAESGAGQPRHRQFFNLHGQMAAFGGFGAAIHEDYAAAQVIQTRPPAGLLVLDALMAPALANDWSHWLHQLHALEVEWFEPILAAVKTGQIGPVTVILSHNTALAEFSVTRRSLQRFWIKPSLDKLLI